MTDDQKTKRGEMLRAMAVMAEVWPRQFCTAEAIRKAPMYERPVSKADPEVFVQAAEEWVDKNKWHPTPSEFAAYVWRLHKQLHPDDSATVNAHYAEQSLDSDLADERNRIASVQSRLNARAMYVAKYCQSGKLEELSAIWALLWEMAENDEARHAIRTGMVTKKEINEAIKAHRDGRRARSMTRLPNVEVPHV